MLQAFEFNANVKDGKINVPDEYLGLVKESVKVIIIQNESGKYSEKRDEFQELFDKTLRDNSSDSIKKDDVNKKRQDFLEFAQKNRVKVEKIEIPSREERNAR